MQRKDEQFEKLMISARTQKKNNLQQMVEKAGSDEGATFIVTVKAIDLPECWGIRLNDIPPRKPSKRNLFY